MGVMKFIVICLVILVAYCEEIEKQQEYTATIVNTRFKRETENDRVSKEQTPKLTLRRQPIRPFIPTTKTRQPKTAYPANSLPRKKMIPVVNVIPNLVTKTKNTDHQNLNEVKIVSSNLTLNSSANKSCGDNKTDRKTIAPENSLKEIRNNEGNIFIKTEDHITEPDTTSRLEKNSKKAFKIELDSSNKTRTNAVTIKRANKNDDSVPIKEVVSLKVDLDVTLPKEDPGFKIVAGCPVEKIGKLSEEAQNNPNKIAQENSNDIKDNLTDMVIKPKSDTQTITKKKDIGEMLQTKVGPLFPLVDTTKMFVSKIKPLQEVKLMDKIDISAAANSYNISSDIVNENGQMNIQRHDLTPCESSKDDSEEEIVIENHNYEELYENVTQEYCNPSLVTSELRSSPLFYENIKTFRPWNQFGTPYSYNINKVGNQYFVDTIDNEETEHDDSNFIDDESCTSKEKQSTDKNNNMWNKNYKAYNQYQPQFNRQGANFGNYKTHGFPNRIWRSWNNNQIFIKPKSGNLANTELYKGLGNYLANFNTQNTTVYNPCKFNNPFTNKNHNTSPYFVPFQYNRYYGY